MDAAFEWLDRAVEQKATALGTQFLEHYYDPIRDDPRWMEFLRRTGSAPEQREAIDFEITLPRGLQPTSAAQLDSRNP